MKHFISDFKEHLSHYLVLIAILIIGTVSFNYFSRYPQSQIISVFLTASFYVLWGIVHHSQKGDLHIRVILEYVAVALLGFLILWTILMRV